MKQNRLLTILWAMTLMLAIVPQRAWASYRAVATKGKLPGAFSVSATKQVWFSQGNLQYQADNGDGGSTWRFAIKQYDFVGDATHGNVYEKDVKTGGLMVQGASAWNGSGSSGDPYLIASPADWETFATSTDAYSNTFFKLTADITVTTMRTKTFSGTFDGGGNTLTFNYTATGDNAAPFAYITGATIKNLRVAGTITTSKKFAAGIVAISNGGAITNCRSSVTINSSKDGDGTHGGLVADSYTGTLNITNCLFDGKLLGTTTTSCGGIVGWHNSNSTLNITNTLFAPAEVTVQGGAIFARNGATSLTNCYYISNWSAATVQGTNANSMTAAALVTALNNGTKNWCVHRGNAIPVMVNLVISTKAQWDTFAANVGNYDSKYVQLGANIGTANAPITTMTTSATSFKGIFDGNGYTLTVNYTATGEKVAPFRYITGATIKNLRVAGTINAGGHKFAAGIVSISNGGTIENCRSSVTINSSIEGDGTHGGLVADSYQGTLDINNCLFDGKLLGENTTSCGGFVGWHNSGTLNISNSLFAPTQVTLKGGVIFARNSATALTDCYYISDWAAATVQGTNANSMTTAALVTALNGSNKNWCIHRGNAIPIMVNLVISTKAQWDTFAANVGNYDGKYVQLGANIGTANDPITTMTTKSTSFRGIFDGNGKTMTVNFSADTGNEGAFRYLNDGTIMNLTITGTVTAGGNYASGLVARTSGGDCLIDNCVVNTNVAGSGYAGGIVAHGDNATKLTITNCIYGGEISKVSSFSGGILGWYNNNGTMDLVINNCLCKGIYTGTADFHPIGLKRATDCSFKSISCTNCYYTTNPHNPNGRNFTDGTKVSELSLGDDVTASGNTCTFEGITYHYGMVTLGYNGPMATTNFSLDGTHLDDNSFTISTDNAAFDDGTATIKWDFPGRGTEGDPYQISSAAVWDFLADEVDTGNNNYEGKYFRQTGDFTITRMVGAADNADDSNYNDEVFRTFNGTYDGYGHTLDLNLDVTGERYVGPFHCVSGATIKNLKVTGSVQVRENTNGAASIHHASALIGCARGTGQVTIVNCLVSASVGTAEYMGGLIGHSWNANVTIEGCVYSGTLTATGTNYTGGFIGWGGTNGNCTFNLTNNIFAGTYSGNGKFHPVGFLYNPTGNTRTVTNTYYMTGLRNVGDDDGNSLVKGLANKGKFAYSITGGTGVTVSNAGTPTTYYNVSDITSYGIGIKYGEVLYGGNSDAINLNLSATNHAGYSVYDYSTNNGSLTGDDNPYTLTMAAANATINVRYSTLKSITAATSNENGWYLIASPFESVTPSSENGFITNSYDLFRFNQSVEQEWENWEQTGSHYHFDLEPGRGYLYANSSDVTLTFIGTPYSGTGVVNLEYSTSNPDSRMHGWNLIGNPFSVTATIGEKPFYRMNNDHNEIIPAVDNNIAPMEGVFVQATGLNQTVTFSTGAKRETDGSEDCIVINLSDNKGTIIDRAIVSFNEGHTLPKFQIRDNSTKLYIPQNGKDYAIAFAYRIGELPLNFKAQETGVYTLNFNGDNMTAVSLVDMIEGAIIDLSVNDTYTFIGTSADRADRFKLVFSSPNDSNIDIFAYQTGNDIVVSGEGDLQAFDVMGRMVISQHINGVQTVTQPLQTGVYIFRLNEKSQKIVVR